MENLLILGAGGSSQQIAQAVFDINRQAPRWNIVGFLDDDPAKFGTMINGVPVMGPLSEVRKHSARVIVGIASWHEPERRRRIVGQIDFPAERFATLIHPSSCIASSVRLGAGTAILQGVVITQNTVIGDHVIVLHNVSVGHDVRIDHGATIAAGAVLTGLTHVCAGAYVGAASAINNAVTVHEGAVVGLGAVVVKDVPKGVTVVGNPARPLLAKVPELSSAAR